ncbi:MAG TPA: SGNH/GDSL hydrolase family protein [Galbitalea sp.]|jgi:lysophospholipase L1-like esterase|nr:SGNH/GDSL hydrolase family protein [Galbitalea sp.]
MDQARVAFYGDSYTLGTGASSAALRWSSIICAQRGWREFNPSINGLGFVNNRHNFGDGDLPSRIIASSPDIVFVTLGLNDNFNFALASDRIHTQISTDLEYLRLALPMARFIVVEPFWYTDERPESLAIITGWVRTAAQFIDADYVEGASRWIDHRPDLMASDGLHPNDAGYAVIAAQMDAALAKLRLPAAV